MTARHRGPITGRHVLVGLLAMFGVVIAVNGTFVYFALATHPGVVVENSYEKGLHYNATLDAAAAQRRRGWRAELGIVHDGARRGALTLRIVDTAGALVGDLTLTGTLRRPAASGHDRSLAFAPAGDGGYRATYELPLSGNWELTVEGSRGARRVFRLERRLWLD